MSMMKCCYCPALVDCDEFPESLYVKDHDGSCVCPYCFTARDLDIEEGDAPVMPYLAAMLCLCMLIFLPCTSCAYDMQVQLTGWKYAIQLLDPYPVTVKSRTIPDFAQKLDAVNREINAIPYVQDASTYREENVWQTPLQFAQVGGECRDYAVAKYQALYTLGVADADMQFVAVRILRGKHKGEFHAVLEVKHASRAYLLDNLHNDVRPASAMADYQPLYFINRQGWRTAQ
jgi:predicted transglutaminase-like cysteine proteinase